MPTELQSSSDINISTKAVYWELHSMGYHGWAAVITVYVIKVWQMGLLEDQKLDLVLQISALSTL